MSIKIKSTTTISTSGVNVIKNYHVTFVFKSKIYN